VRVSLDRVVVVGASVAGLTAAETLRQEGFSGTLTVIGAEEHPPYDRPPLSKQVLAGTWGPERTTLRKEEALATLEAQWRLGSVASGIDTTERQVRLADGTEVGYDGLVIATGVTPRRLPFGHDLAGVHTLRSVDDALALRDGLRNAGSLVVVGAGFLGMEAAASAVALGLRVTVVDPLPTPMVRQFGPVIGEQIAALHRGHDVDLRFGVGVAELTGTDGRVDGVRLSGGTVIPAEVVLVAIGAVPETAWLAGSGLALTNGVDCDERCQAAPDIVAAGDVASWIHPGLGERVRCEHRMNATEQGRAAAKTLIGNGKPFAPVPFFWTDQYDVKVQAYGMFPEQAEPALVDGAFEEGRFTVEYRLDGAVTGVLGWNMPKETRTLRAKIHLVAQAAG
jgi:NADPH-dependent 2,4-dienoyl-CoA reductase/sulfur reductase-like enzyme